MLRSAHDTLTNEYLRNGAVEWGGSSSWWVIETAESFNGWRDTWQGNFTRWDKLLQYAGRGR